MKNKKYRVTATVTLSCSREVEAQDEDDAYEQCRYTNAMEWVEGFTVENESVDLEEVLRVPEKTKRKGTK